MRKKDTLISLNRRQMLQATGSALAFTIVPRFVLGGEGNTPPSEKLNIAGIGIGGQGGGVLNDMSSQNIVALCDVDWKYAAGAFEKYPDAKRYWDYREMLDKEDKNIDAVMVATPDHTHAPIAIRAMRMKKHVYVEKPMAHTIYEARLMTKVAREEGIVSQMGQNGHAGEGLRLTYEYIHDGAIGTVREVHGWSDRPAGWWPQAVQRPTDTPEVPETLNWDLWLGPAPMRPYHPDYTPFKWRGWHDFGCGAMGDMAVHNVDPAFFCLDLDAPIAVEAETGKTASETFPEWQIITYYFAEKNGRAPVKMVWYDGKKMPPKPEAMEADLELPDNGIIFIGDKGAMQCGGWSGAPRLIPESRMQEYPRPEKTLARSVGHRQEWIDACKANDPKGALAGFEYSGPFTEALLVGDLAVRLEKRIEWDSASMKATNAPEADILINKAYREGWELEKL